MCQDEIETPAVRRYIHDLSAPIGIRLKRIRDFIPIFTETGMSDISITFVYYMDAHRCEDHTRGPKALSGKLDQPVHRRHSFLRRNGDYDPVLVWRHKQCEGERSERILVRVPGLQYQRSCQQPAWADMDARNLVGTCRIGMSNNRLS